MKSGQPNRVCPHTYSLGSTVRERINNHQVLRRRKCRPIARRLIEGQSNYRTQRTSRLKTRFAGMESLSLGEARPFTYSSNGNRQKERRRRSHRLPTPDASRSSDEAFEPSNASMTPRHGPPMHNPFKYPSPVRYSPMSPLHDAHNIRHDRRQTCAPDSPPYSGFDAQKPSLPPLKTVWFKFGLFRG